MNQQEIRNRMRMAGIPRRVIAEVLKSETSGRRPHVGTRKSDGAGEGTAFSVAGRTETGAECRAGRKTVVAPHISVQNALRMVPERKRAADGCCPRVQISVFLIFYPECPIYETENGYMHQEE